MVRSIKLVDPLASLLPKMCVSNHPQIFFGPNLDYSDIIYEKHFYITIHQKLPLV